MNQNNYIVAPSILSANFLELREELNKIKDLGIEWIHFDIMDNHFVPNLTFGPKILEDINSEFNFKIDAHFMTLIDDFSMEDYLLPYFNSGIDQITMHYESLTKNQIEQLMVFCKEKKILFSLAIKPNTSIEVLEPYLHDLDNILIMSVEPGFGGQSFLENSTQKVSKLKELKNNNNYKFRIQVDGGINEKTNKLVKGAGVDMVVAGSYLFGHIDIKERYEKLIND